MDMTVTIKHYADQLKAQGYADSTMELYRKGLERFREYLSGIGKTDLRTVTKETIIDYQALVLAGTQAPETKAIRIRPVKRLFEYLTAINRLLINPAEGIRETCRKNRKIGPVLTREEMEILLHQPDMGTNCGIRDRAVMEVLYATALRIAECLALTLDDIDLTEEVVFVRKAKGRKQRVVPLGKSATGFVKEYLEKVRPRHGKRFPQERRLFFTNRGKPLGRWNVWQNFYQYARQAGIDKCASPHAFRRSCATHMLQQGADIRFIQELLGHKSLATTQRYCLAMPVEIKETHQRTHPGRTL
jgi:integrase/recombinase XerD